MGKATHADLAGVFRVLSDPTRLAIFDLLMQGVRCNCELGGKLDLPMNLISHHLKALRDAGLITAERDSNDARWVYYSINPRTLAHVRSHIAAFLDPARVRARVPSCRPTSVPVETGRRARR